MPQELRESMLRKTETEICCDYHVFYFSRGLSITENLAFNF